MNEHAGQAAVVNDLGHGPNPLNGKVGSSVVTGYRVPGLVGYKIPSPAPTGYDPRRIVVVPNDTRLNPSGHDFVVTLRFRGKYDGNIVQKGQATSAGGYWKVETHGSTTCTFKGSAGLVAVTNRLRLTDNHWHTVRCERNGSKMSMTVDGKQVDKRIRATGVIANNLPLTVGGKGTCDASGGRVTCDYFVGEIDRVEIDSL